jgi:chromosome segregation ATPase
VAANSALQPTSKLQAIYRTVNSYFDKVLASRNGALDQAYGENQAIRAVVHEFLVSLSISVGLQPVSFSDFFVQRSGDRLLTAVARLKSAHDDLRRGHDRLSAAISQIGEQVNVSAESDPLTVAREVSLLKERSDRTNETSRQRSKKSRELNDQLKSLQKKSENDITYLTSQIQAQKETIESITARLKELEATNLALRKELHGARASITDLQIQSDEARTALMKEYESKLQVARDAQDALESQLRDEIRNHQHQYTECADSLEESSSTIKILKRTIRAQKETMAEKDREIAALKHDASENEQLLRDRAESDKSHLAEAFRQAQAELQQQCEAHRQDVQRLADELSASEKRTKEARAQILELRREVQRLEKDSRSQEEQASREKRLHDAAVRAATLSAESDSATKLNEQKAQADNEKRRILVYVTDAFKQFFNPQDAIDEKTLKQVVGKARDELAALTETNTVIRRIVRASAHQRTDDAVAQAVMGRTWS